MPTADRPKRAQQAIQDFLAQDYEPRELIVLDDGAPPVEVPKDPRIKLVRCEDRRTLGPKREALVQLAQGEVMILWDDDDWHGRRRISAQVAVLGGGKEASLLDQVYAYDELTGIYWESPPQRQFPGTLAFTRLFHSYGGFPAVDVGADRYFIWARPARMLAWIDGREHYLLIRHGSHRTSMSYVGWRQLPGVGVLELDVDVCRGDEVRPVDVDHR